jgi:hypothetical protein
MKQYVLTKTVFSRLTKRHGTLICFYCGQPIQPIEKEWKFTFTNGLLKITLIKNPEVISISHGNRGKVKHYHRECYEKTLH